MEIATRLKLPPNEQMARLVGDRFAFTVSTSHTNFGSSKLLVDNLDDIMLCWGHRRSQCWISAVMDLYPRVRNIKYIGALGTNRNPSEITSGYLLNTTNEARIYFDLTYPLVNRLRPEVTALSLTNLTGSIADIYKVSGDPVDPPQTHISDTYVQSRLHVVNPALDTSALITFANHYATERPLATGDSQIIKVHVRRSDSATAWPTITTTLRQNGVDLAVISHEDEEAGITTEAEQTTEGFIFTYRFQAGIDLPSQTLPIQIRVDGTSVAGAAPEIIKVEWFAALQNITFDSGWIDLELEPDLVDVSELVGAAQQSYCFIQWSDYSSVRTYSLSGHTVKSFSDLGRFQALEVGRFIAVETLSVPMVGDSSYTPRKVQGPNNASRVYQGGLRSPRNAATWWEADVVICAQKQSDIFGYLEDQFNALGLMTLPTLFIPDPDDLSTMIWACLSAWEAPHKGMFSGTDDDGLPYSNQHMYELNFSIVEKTGRRTTGG